MTRRVFPVILFLSLRQAEQKASRTFFGILDLNPPFGTAYVQEQVHTNGCENFWSLFKRTIGGTYVHISPFHLFRYAAEQVFRFNNRAWTDAQRFRFVLSQVFGRQLTYRLLAGIDGAGFMGLE